MRGFRLLAAAVVAFSFAGCGGYREDVARTRRFLDYQRTLAASLSQATWRNERIELRVPKPFEHVPVKPVSKSADDARPALLKSFEGVESLWKARLKCRDGVMRNGWLVVASNHSLWTQGNATLEDSERYAERTLARLFEAGNKIAPPKPEWKPLDLTRRGEFVTPKLIHAFTVTLPAGKVYEKRGVAKIQIQTHGSLQVVLIWLLPANLAATDQPVDQEAIELSLSTLKVHDESGTVAAQTP